LTAFGEIDFVPFDGLIFSNSRLSDLCLTSFLTVPDFWALGWLSVSLELGGVVGFETFDLTTLEIDDLLMTDCLLTFCTTSLASAIGLANFGTVFGWCCCVLLLGFSFFISFGLWLFGEVRFTPFVNALVDKLLGNFVFGFGGVMVGFGTNMFTSTT